MKTLKRALLFIGIILSYILLFCCIGLIMVSELARIIVFIIVLGILTYLIYSTTWNYVKKRIK